MEDSNKISEYVGLGGRFRWLYSIALSDYNDKLEALYV